MGVGLQKKFQIWRLATSFCFFGGFSIPWVFQMYFLTNYVGRLESEVFEQSPRGTADLLFLLGFCGLIMMLVSYFMPGLGLQFLGSSLVFACMYIWSRTDPFRIVTLYGFSIKAWHFPFVIMFLTLLMGGGVGANVIGVLTGHLFFFLWRIVPNRYHKQMLSTPEFLFRLVDRTAQAHRPRFNWQQGGGGRLN